MDIAKRILATQSGIFIAAPVELSRQVAAEIAASGEPLIQVAQDQDPKRVIAEALRAADIPPQQTMAASLAELSDSLQRPVVLLIEAVERYESADLMYELKAARDQLNISSHPGLCLAFFGTDPQVLRSLCRHHMAAFFCAEYLDASAVRAHV